MTTETPGGRQRWQHVAFGIRTRLVLWFLGLFAVLLVVGLVAIRQVMLVGLEEEVDRALAQESEELRLFAGESDPTTGQPYAADVTTMYEQFLARNVPVDGEAMFAVVDAQVTASSPQPMVEGLTDPSLTAEWAAAVVPTWGESSTDAGRVRWLSVPVVTPGSKSHFVIANLIGNDQEEIESAVRTMAVVSLGVLMVASLLGWLSASQALAPIRQVTRTARSISDDDLSERIPVVGNDEVAELSITFNEMLDRLDTAFTTQRRFLDDVGHDLRTPITIVRGHLELLPDDPIERAAVIQSCLDELDAMTRQVADLFTLAQAGRPDFLRPVPIDIARFTDTIEQRAHGLAPDRRWQIEHLAPVEIRGDPDRLGQAMMNLVSNAVAHTDAGSPIRLGSRLDGRELRLWVSDAGPGIAHADQERIFERFDRGTDRFTRARDGAGLGLAIVRMVAEAHGGRVELESELGVGSTFTIVLPAPPETPTAEDDIVIHASDDTVETRLADDTVEHHFADNTAEHHFADDPTEVQPRTEVPR